MQEESEEWACQAEAYRNEVDSIKAEMKSEVESKDKQIKILQQTLQVCSGIDILLDIYLYFDNRVCNSN